MRTKSPVAQLPLEIGQQVHLAGDPYPWTVKAVSEHFAALTRLVEDNERGLDDVDWPELVDELEEGTVLYTVLDWRNGVRGPCNLVGQAWGDGTYTEADCAEMLAEFESGDLEISHRNRVRIEFGEVAW
jgi:hypothetical protein